MSVRRTLWAFACGAVLFIGQPVPYLLHDRISQAAARAESGSYGAQTISEVLADLYYWTDPWWTAGIVLFTLTLVLQRLVAHGTRAKQVIVSSLLAQFSYFLPAFGAAVFASEAGSTERINFVLVEFFFFGNGWLALALALLFNLLSTRPLATTRARKDRGLSQRYHFRNERGTSS